MKKLESIRTNEDLSRKTAAVLTTAVLGLVVGGMLTGVVFAAKIFDTEAYQERVRIMNEQGLEFGNDLYQWLDSNELPKISFPVGYDLDAIADFTFSFEGFRNCAYEDLGTKIDPETGDVIKLWSIGYGTPSYPGECISEVEARSRKMSSLDWAVKFVHGYTGVIPQDHMTALADTIYNVDADNYDYILRQYHHPERKKELGYALGRMACAWNGEGVCVRYKGLQRRYEARMKLLFN